MNLETLRQIIASIREIEPDRRLVIFGSSSVLASFPNESPESLGIEITIDADVFLDPDDQAARESLLNIMGEGRAYHQENGFYCDFIDARADYGFPLGWKSRLVASAGCSGI